MAEEGELKNKLFLCSGFQIFIQCYKVFLSIYSSERKLLIPYK